MEIIWGSLIESINLERNPYFPGRQSMVCGWQPRVIPWEACYSAHTQVHCGCHRGTPKAYGYTGLPRAAAGGSLKEGVFTKDELWLLGAGEGSLLTLLDLPTLSPWDTPVAGSFPLQVPGQIQHGAAPLPLFSPPGKTLSHVLNKMKDEYSVTWRAASVCQVNSNT